MDDDEALLMLSERRAARALEKAPELVGFIRGQVIPFGAGGSDGMPRAPKGEPPLPFRAEAVEDADGLYSMLVNWSMLWYRRLPALAPEVRLRDGDESGLPLGVTSAGAHTLTFLVCRWLRAHHDRIVVMPSAGEYFEEVAEAVGKLRPRYPMAPRPARKALPRACPVCREFGVVARIPQDVRDTEVVCLNCGHVVPWVSYQEIVEGWMKK